MQGIKYIGNFTFHPVGHGLFYTGIIKSLASKKQFSFIYDCGGKTNEIINKAIESAELPESIDMLVISHFHSDHIKGIIELTKKHKIKAAILPYLDDTQKIIYLATLAEENENNDDLIDFILNPEHLLGNNTDIFYMTNNFNDIKDISEKPVRPRKSSENDFDFVWNNCMQLKMDTNKNIISGDANYISTIWTFNFFMPKIDPNYNKMQNFFAKNKITINNAIKSWRLIAKQMKFLNLSNNISNIVCAHGPIKPLIFVNYRSNKLSSYPGLSIYPHYLFYFDEQFGFQFLTEDAEIDNENDFQIRYKDYLYKTILFQIPHHGSKKNWHDWFSEYMPFCCLWPVTHNSDHKYHRGIFPSATFSFIAPYSVTEVESTKLGIQMYFIN